MFLTKNARTVAFVLLASLVVVVARPARLSAQRNVRARGNASPAAGPRDYKSRNFLVHTDMPPEEAQDLLEKLETMLSLISRYWGRPNKQTIECFVVQDLKNWPAGTLDPQGVQSIQRGGGITLSQSITQGARFLAKSRVFAGSERGTAQHEAVHAYCYQNFGRTGPVWYSEGMAEMGQYWVKDDRGVNCREEVCEYLRRAQRKSVQEIVNEPQTTGDSWQNYARRWALCHLLATNSNYADRFRPLGLALLTNKPASFEAVYGTMLPEIEFEYSLFLDQVCRGYRADLCSWDWKTSFKQPKGRSALVSRIAAAGGWQASRAEVKSGQTYLVESTGKWSLGKDEDAVTAAGDESGRGQLLGIIYSDYKLSEPFEVGKAGQFTASMDGQLMLRCNDDWSSVGDNTGKLTVRIKAP